MSVLDALEKFVSLMCGVWFLMSGEWRISDKKCLIGREQPKKVSKTLLSQHVRQTDGLVNSAVAGASEYWWPTRNYYATGNFFGQH